MTRLHPLQMESHGHRERFPLAVSARSSGHRNWASSLRRGIAITSQVRRTASSGQGIPIFLATSWDSAQLGTGSSSLQVDLAATSPDGSTWTAQTITVNSGWRGLAYNGSRIVAVGIGSGVNDNVATSDDGGTTWISRSLPSVPGSGLAAVAWNGQIFAALAFTGTAGYSSPDGITWTERVVPNAGYAAIAVKS